MSTVMLIEDDETMIGLLKTLLEIEGHEVTQWDGKREIIGSIQEEKPDILLLDVNLKNANGFDILHGLREGGLLEDIRVIMSSGIDYSDRSLEEGADDFLLKPYMPDDLIELIRKNLSS